MKRMGQCLVLIVTFWVGVSVADATSPRPEPDAQETLEKTVQQILREEGLLRRGRCLAFVDPHALDYRTERWFRALRRMERAQPGFVIQWIIGKRTPPAQARSEAEDQARCLLGAMVEEAASPDTSLHLSKRSRKPTSQQLQRRAQRFWTHRKVRDRIVERIVVSGYRNARDQATIWKRKWRFVGRRFNRISPEAAERCQLTAGHSWNPEHPRHIRCWRQELDSAARQREILVASSAPGLSRHHWGTDFDLFGLNPRQFREQGPYADEFQWLTAHGPAHGFFQPYSGEVDRKGYMEERWHWSYHPIAQALMRFAQEHPTELEDALQTQWQELEKRWNRKRRRPHDYFGWIRQHWRPFVFEVADR